MRLVVILLLGLPEIFTPCDALAWGGQPAEPESPQIASSWQLSPFASSPAISSPSSLVCSWEGTVFVGCHKDLQSTSVSDKPGFIVAVRGRGTGQRITEFADKLHAIVGLEQVADALFVLHPPILSRLRDTNGDGRADERIDLASGLGQLAKHERAGELRFGMDGFLYLSIAAKSTLRVVAKDTSAVETARASLLRVRPDGSRLELVTAPVTAPDSLFLTAHDEVLSLAKTEPHGQNLQLFHHLDDGGHKSAGGNSQVGGNGPQSQSKGPRPAGIRGICYEGYRFPAQFRGNLFAVHGPQKRILRIGVEPSGASIRIKGQPQLLASWGPAAGFTPVALAATPGGESLLIAGKDAKNASGQLFELEPKDFGPRHAPLFPNREHLTQGEIIVEYCHLPYRENYIGLQRQLIARGPGETTGLIQALATKGPASARIRAMWILDQIGGPRANQAIMTALDDPAALVRAHAARAVGIRKDSQAVGKLAHLLKDRDPAVRREAAIALGRIRGPDSVRALKGRTSEDDQNVRKAIQSGLLRLGVRD